MKLRLELWDPDFLGFVGNYQAILGSQVVLVVKNLPANAGGIRDAGLIPGSRRSSGVGNGNPLQYSYLENPMTAEPGRLSSMGLEIVRLD